MTANYGVGQEAVDFDPFAEGELSATVSATEAQREIWVAAQMGPEASCAYNESISLHFRGPLDVAAFRDALQALIQRHEALRTTFSADGASLCIVDEVSLPFTIVDLSDEPAPVRAQEIEVLLRKEMAQAFDLERGPLFRAQLIQLSQSEHRVIITAHHIICDGLSWGVLLPDLSALYKARLDGQAGELPLADRYSDYVRYLETAEQKKTFAMAESYWLGQYADAVPQLELPTDQARPAVKTYVADRLDYTLDAELFGGLKQLGASLGATPVATLMAAFNVFLYRLSGQSDIVVGLMSGGQSAAGFQNLVGHCVNVMPIRSKLQGEQSFSGYLKSFRTVMLDAQEHQQLSFGGLLKKLAVDRAPGRIPLVPVTFNMDQAISGLAFPQLEADVLSNKRRFENFELFLNAVEMPGNGLILECSYNRDLFSVDTIQRRMAGFEQLIASVVNNAEQSLEDILIVPDAEQALLTHWNQTACEFSTIAVIHELIDAQAQKSPHKTAVVCAGQVVSYDELNTASHQLACFLRDQGVQPGDCVALALPRSETMLVAILGILKAGAAYLPLDPEYPEARLSYMLEDAQVSFLVTVADLQARFPATLRSIALDSASDALAIQQTAVSAALPEVTPDSLAYVIYTSGSTGEPKGVEVEHGSVVNFLQSMAKKPGIASDDVVLAVTTLSFDIAVLELLLPLVVGAKVVVATREMAADGDVLAQTIEQQKITLMQATPATWRMLLDAGWAGADALKILSGGEALPVSLAHALNKCSATLWNMYGPTETTVWSSCGEVRPGDQRMTIGKPIDNTRFYILDDRLQSLPVGIAGELYIAGTGVVRGYLRQPELTAERFVVHQGERLYRTGDRARFLPNGDVEHLGRIDDQVKLRGFRIELGEVETALAQYSGVKSAVAAIKQGVPGDARLAAYVVADPGQTIDAADLRDHCLRLLPEYMVPQYFQTVAEIPLTPNGKTDRQALPDPEVFVEARQGAFVGAETAMEHQVLAVWKSVLRIDLIGATDNFFNLGGHSLLATQIVTRLRRELDQAFPVAVLFECPTVRLMAARLEERPESDVIVAPAIQRRVDNLPAPLSQTQQRLLFIQQLYPDSAVFNQIGVWRLTGAVDIDAFKAAVKQVVQRHDILRSKIVTQDRREVLQPSLENGPELMLLDLQQTPETQREQALLDAIDNITQQPFELERDALIRVQIVLMGPRHCVLMVMSHPIIWDGWSFDVFLQEFAGFYRAIKQHTASPLPELTLQYADYPAWHQNWMAQGEGERQIHYWKEKLQGASVHIAIPKDYERPQLASHRGARESLFIPQQEIETLTRLAHSEGVTLYMVLLAAFKTLLFRYSKQDDIVIATQVQGRVRPEFERLIGPFVNTVLLRSRLESSLGFRTFLQQTRQTCLEAFAHQDVPFEQVIDSVTMNHAGERSSSYQVMFTFQDTRNRAAQFADLDISQINHNTHVAYTDWLFWLKETGEGLYGGLDYSTDLFSAESMSRVMADYRQILQSIGTNLELEINAIPLSSNQVVVAHDEVIEQPVVVEKTQPSETLTPIQKRIIKIWSDALEIDDIDIYDNFFELGGHSLLSMQVLAKIRNEMDVHIPARAILMDNLAQIAAYCEPSDDPVEAPQAREQKKPSRSRSMMSRLSKPLGLLRGIKKSPDAAVQKQKAEYEAHFSSATSENLFRGVYSNFNEALKTTPDTKPMGYDHSDPASMYKDRLERIYPSDYPVLFWLEKALAEGGHQVFDLGGHIGVGFYAYQKYIQYPGDIDWKVCDVTAVTEAGKKLAIKRKVDQLSFTTDNQAADGRDIFFASGALQYLEIPLATQLAKLRQPPKHIILNLLPLYEGEAFATLQNIGTAFCPYQVLNKQQFIASLQQQGYEMIDHWENPDKGCHIPFHSEQSLDHYDGFYFRRA